jgi:hypothetical protein
LPLYPQFGELDIGHHVGATPEPCEEEHGQHPAHHEAPPEPVAGDAVCGDEARDDERRVGGKCGRHHRRAGEPPRHLPAREEILVQAFATAAGEREANAGRQDEVGGDDRPINPG